MTWLLGNKCSLHTKPISEKEYLDKANQLKLDLDTLWNSFVFGNKEGNIPKEYLTLRITDINTDIEELKTFTPEEMKENLDKWFTASMPDDFGNEFLIEKAKIQKDENKIVIQTKDLLKKKGLNDSLIHEKLFPLILQKQDFLREFSI